MIKIFIHRKFGTFCFQHSAENRGSRYAKMIGFKFSYTF